MISIARIFGAPDSVPAGRQARSASIAPQSGPQRARSPTRRCASRASRSRSPSARSTSTLPNSHTRPEVVAAEVDEHHVLGALLLVARAARSATRRSSSGLAAARPRAGDRPHLDAAAGHLHAAARARRPRSRSRRTRGSTCRARGSRPAGRGRPRTARPGTGPLQRCDGTTWKTSPAKMYSFARSTAASYSRLRHVRLERGQRVGGPRAPARGARDRLGEQLARALDQRRPPARRPRRRRRRRRRTRSP